MSYRSVDQLQEALTKNVFGYAKDSRKAAGRALGTLVEIVTFYALKSWGLETSIAIERGLPEFGNAEITHNVEFSIHPSETVASVPFLAKDLPLTSKKICRTQEEVATYVVDPASIRSNTLLTRKFILRNSCAVYEQGDRFLSAYLDAFNGREGTYAVARLRTKPFAMVECKRVGVEEGMTKGPQTIEKAKQGAYVAGAVSALHKFRLSNGEMWGAIENADGSLITDRYDDLLATVVASNDPELLADFVLTIGVVSNHGNWFTAESQNKELKVLAQSYDWLVFLSDTGLAQFVEDLLLEPEPNMLAARDSFLASYTGERGAKNSFTKVQMALDADAVLQNYFEANGGVIDTWFNVIAPAGKPISTLKAELRALANKDWEAIHA